MMYSEYALSAVIVTCPVQDGREGQPQYVGGKLGGTLDVALLSHERSAARALWASAELCEAQDVLVLNLHLVVEVPRLLVLGGAALRAGQRTLVADVPTLSAVVAAPRLRAARFAHV